MVRRLDVVVGGLEPLMLAGVVAALGKARRICLTAVDVDGHAFERALAARDVDVVILDERVPYSLLVGLKSRPRPPLVVLLVGERPLIYRTMLQQVGIECLGRGASAQELLSGVYEAAARREPVRRRAGDPASVELTSREAEVLSYMRDRELTYAEIAVELGVSESTIKTHAASIRRKLGGARTRRGL
jgi:DNA-binding NarL/FixJ family response regulator